MTDAACHVRQLESADVPLMRSLNALFAVAFADVPAYAGELPSDAYLAALLARPHIIPLVALLDGAVVGGLVAYELEKLEREGSEVYIYDLAVAEGHRRKGIATALLDALVDSAAARGASAVFVQADYGDEAAIALYAKLGARKEVLHFEIAMTGRS